MTYKKILKSFLPAIMLDVYSRLNYKNYVRFVGIYQKWEDAEKNSKGYNTVTILQQAIEKTQMVVSGKVAYERDGVVFEKQSYSYPLLASLLRASSENGNSLTVLDFGGSLGSTYYQCRSFLQGVDGLKWCVVEQSHFVEAGNTHFTDDILSFYDSIGDAVKQYKPGVVLFSGVLQYLPEPFITLQEAISSGANYIVIDRTPFIIKGKKVLSLQKVPKSIVDSSYPVWLFNEQELRQIFEKKYTEIAEFDAIDGTIGQGYLTAQFKGIIFKRILGE